MFRDNHPIIRINHCLNADENDKMLHILVTKRNECTYRNDSIKGPYIENVSNRAKLEMNCFSLSQRELLFILYLIYGTNKNAIHHLVFEP